MKALVLLGGHVTEGLLLSELGPANLVIAADSGATHLDAIGRTPDIVAGDMDSIDPALLEKLESRGVEVVRASAEKDETDGQMALDLAMARGADEIALLGAVGGRLDHTLGNLMLLVRAAKLGVRAFIRDESCEIIAATGQVEIIGKAGDTVSILPVGEGVSVRYLDGLKYGTKEPLPLPADVPVGVSNVMIATKVNIAVEGYVNIIKIKRD